MKSSIREFWAQLNGSIHPLDIPYFKKAEGKHSFNLDYPPPAFIGDVDNAKVIVLMASGGFGKETQLEFPTQDDHQEHIDWLVGRRKEMPKNLSRYYIDNNLFSWIESGKAVLVNAIAYRSPKISEEPENEALGKTLPSYQASLAWLNQEVLPLTLKNQRLLVAHRWRLWGLNRNSINSPENLIFSNNPVSPHLSELTKGKIRAWLKGSET
jgi:hypothetical protein